MNAALKLTLAFAMSVTAEIAGAAIADFEDLPLSPNSYFNGDPGGLTPGQSHDGSFFSSGARFNNLFVVDPDFGFSYWNGWAYSNKTDTTTAGFANQYSAFAGSGSASSGSGGSATYGIGFISMPDPVIELPLGAAPISLDVTNTTYAALSMLRGDSFARKFGDDPTTVGVVETDFPDFFKLTIGGETASGQPLATTIDVYLADYRFANDTDDFVLDTWQTVSLASLAGASRLTFALESSDVGPFGSNTPGYFAVDNLIFADVPEPSGVLLVAAAVGILGALRIAKNWLTTMVCR
jgi:uncharacterized protein DUF4465